MERVAALGRRVLPRGWRHFGIQLVIWFGFYFSYLGVRHLTYATPGKALGNGLRVISLEQRVTHHLFELTVERVADCEVEDTLGALASLGLVLRRRDREPLPPRRRRGDRRRSHGAACYIVVATASRACSRAWPRYRKPAIVRHSRNAMLEMNATPRLSRVKHGYTTGARSLASRSVTSLARTGITPNVLTTTGVSLCLAAAVLVPFEDHGKFLFYWLAAGT